MDAGSRIPYMRDPVSPNTAQASIPLPLLSRFNFQKPSRPVRDAGRDGPYVKNPAGTGCGMVTLT